MYQGRFILIHLIKCFTFRCYNILVGLLPIKGFQLFLFIEGINKIENKEIRWIEVQRKPWVVLSWVMHKLMTGQNPNKWFQLLTILFRLTKVALNCKTLVDKTKQALKKVRYTKAAPRILNYSSSHYYYYYCCAKYPHKSVKVWKPMMKEFVQDQRNPSNSGIKWMMKKAPCAMQSQIKSHFNFDLKSFL